jgi:hypothetical protein
MALWVGRKWERIEDPGQLPDIMAMGHDTQVFATKDPDRDVNIYRMMSGHRRLATVSVYAEGARKLRAAGLGIGDLIGENGYRLLGDLSKARIDRSGGYSPILLPGDDSTPSEIYEQGGVGRTICGLDFFGNPESFRRHAFRKHEYGLGLVDDGRHWLEMKIPGDNKDHFNVSESSFQAHVDVYQRLKDNDMRGKVPAMPCPLMLVSLPAGTPREYYGKSRGLFFSPKFEVMEYADGRRVVQDGNPAAIDRLMGSRYVERMAHLRSANPRQILADAMGVYLNVMAAAHDAGYEVREDAHFGNIMLCRDSAQHVGDFHNADRIFRHPGQIDYDSPQMKNRIKQDAIRMANELVAFKGQLWTDVEIPFNDYYYNPGALESVYNRIVKKSR